MTFRLLLAGLFALTPIAAGAEPPDLQGLECTITSQQVEAGMTIEVKFLNQNESPVSLAPGARLAWYRDGVATDSMEVTARASRVQNNALVLPAKESRSTLFSVAPDQLQELACNGSSPQAAALHFYQFDRRPKFRCLLKGYDLASVKAKQGCQSSAGLLSFQQNQ